VDNLEQVAKCLGATYRPDTKHQGAVVIRLTNRPLGVRLKLELDTNIGGLRLFVDRDTNQRPSFIGAIEVNDIVSATANFARGEVWFSGGIIELMVSSNGTFRVVYC
jgi:hypothetical protein